MSHAFPIDPAEVLGVAPDASLDEMQAAFRAKSKSLIPMPAATPGRFGSWPALIELMGEARVAWRRPRRTRHKRGRPRPPLHLRREPPRPIARSARGRRRRHPPGKAGRGRASGHPVRAGRPAPASDDQPGGSQPERLAQPELAGRGLGPRPGDAHREPIRVLGRVLLATAKQTGSHASSSRDQAGGFRGWIAYATAAEARHAFDVLRQDLRRHGFGVRQTIRNLSIPRDWQDDDVAF